MVRPNAPGASALEHPAKNCFAAPHVDMVQYIGIITMNSAIGGRAHRHQHVPFLIAAGKWGRWESGGSLSEYYGLIPR